VGLGLGVVATVACATGARQPVSLTGITFAALPGAMFIPARALGEELGKPVTYDPDAHAVTIGSQQLPAAKVLLNGVSLVRLTDAQKLGATVAWDPQSDTATIDLKDAQIAVKPGDKRVVVDQSNQTMTAYQGDTVVLETHVSTGRPGHRTPVGHFLLGPDKEVMHYSHLYENAPMPFSVQVDGNVFIHGFDSVPSYPASHGCIRVPLTHGNPARWFFNWVDVGTPLTIEGAWTEAYRSHLHRHRHRRRHLV